MVSFRRGGADKEWCLRQRNAMKSPMRDFLHVASAVVYVATNTANGKRYIGATDRGIAQRAYKHLWNARRGQRGKFYTAIRKHGPDVFEFKPMVACVDFFAALEVEAQMIAGLRPEYNLTAGGGGVKGLKFSAESRAKMSAAKKGKPNHWSNGAMPPEVRERLADARRSERGRKLTEKQSNAMRVNAKTANAARRRCVMCVTTGVEFESVTAAALGNGVSIATVTNLCLGRFKSRSGLNFRYL